MWPDLIEELRPLMVPSKLFETMFRHVRFTRDRISKPDHADDLAGLDTFSKGFG